MGNSQDPITLHKYLYANSDPANFVDPTGNFGLASFGVASNIRASLTAQQVNIGLSVLDLIFDPQSGSSAKSTGALVLLNFASPALIKTLSKSASSLVRKIVTRKGVPIVPRKGGAALDANALILGLEKGELKAIDSALAGRIPVVSITAAKEFLRKGDKSVLRDFLRSRGGRIGSATTEEAIHALTLQARALGRVVKTKDAAVAGSAIKDGIPLLTRDKRLFNFLSEAGFKVEKF